MKLAADSTEYENVLLYISDSMRFDSVPESLQENGSVIKTISTGLATPESVGSILTGLYPSQHRIWRFSDRLDPSIPTLFDLAPSASLDYGYGGEVLSNMFNSTDVSDRSFRNLTSPFLMVIKDNHPHAPYNINLDDDEENAVSYETYWQQRAGNPDRFRTEYHDGCRSSVDRFDRIVDELEAAGILDETLVIFTADHGELLGEYGMVDHGAPTCPELVCVPTLFFGEDIEDDGITSHIDLFPTIASVFGVDSTDSPGYDLFSGSPPDRLAINHVERLHFAEQSVWDTNGAFVFSEDSLLERARFASRHLRVRAIAPQLRKCPLKVVRTFLRRDRIIGSPSFSEEEAISLLDRTDEQPPSRTSVELDEAVIDQLERLGYKEGDEI